MKALGIVIIVILILLFIWYYYYNNSNSSAGVIVVTKPVAVKAERFNPGFNPVYDKFFTTSVYDHQLDKAVDQKGYSVDDYLLGDKLFRDHSNS